MASSSKADETIHHLLVLLKLNYVYVHRAKDMGEINLRPRRFPALTLAHTLYINYVTVIGINCSHLFTKNMIDEIWSQGKYKIFLKIKICTISHLEYVLWRTQLLPLKILHQYLFNCLCRYFVLGLINCGLTLNQIDSKSLSVVNKHPMIISWKFL